MTTLIIGIITGILAGFIASKIQGGSSRGCIVNLFIGVLGAYLGGFIFDLLGLTAVGFLGNLVCAVFGALIILWIFAKSK